MGRFLVLCASVILTAHVTLAAAEAEAILAEEVPTELLQAEHRAESGRAAEPDSFLDRIADLFGGAAKPAPPQRRPVSPVYPGPHNKRQPHPGTQLQQQSVQSPVQVRPPAGFKRPTNGLQASGSNIKRQTTGKEKEFSFIALNKLYVGRFQSRKLHIFFTKMQEQLPLYHFQMDLCEDWVLCSV